MPRLPRAPPPPEVTVAKPLIRRLTEWDEFTGRFEPVQVVEIKARVPGYLQEIGFTDGQNVEAGQALFTIDPRPYEAALDRAKAQIELAQAQLRLAQLDQARAAKLVSTSAIAKATLDQRDAELSEAEANLDPAQAQAREAELNLGFTRITAPFAGRASDRRVDVGNLVDDATGADHDRPARSDLSRASTCRSRISWPISAPRAKGDLPSTRDQETIVEAHLVDEDGWPHQGTMNFVDNVVDQGSGTIRGRAVFPNPDGLITPGPVRPHPHPGLARVRRDPDPGRRHRHRPVAQDGADGRCRRTWCGPRSSGPGPSQPGGLRIVRARPRRPTTASSSTA